MHDDSQLPARREAAPIDVVTHRVGGLGAAPPPTDEQEGPGISLGQLWTYRWSMLCVFLAIVGAALPAIWSNIEPMYRGEALIEVKPTQEILVYQTPQVGYGSYWSFLSTQVGILTSNEILKRVVAREDVQGTDWYQHPARPMFGLKDPAAPYERLRDLLEVRPDGDSQLVLIAAETRLANEAPLLCNALAEEYLAYITTQNEEAGERNLVSLRQKVKDREAEYAELDRQAAVLAAKLGTRRPDDLISEQRLRLDLLQAEVANKAVEITAARAQLEEMRARSSQVEAAPVEGPGYEADQRWQQLSSEAAQAADAVAAAKVRLGPANPQVAILSEQLQAAEKRLQDRETYLDTHQNTVVAAPARPSDNKQLALATMTAAQLEKYVRSLELHHEPLVQRVRDYSAEVDETFRKAQELNDLNRRLGNLGEVLDDVRRALTRRETERDAPDRITLAAPAIVPARAHKDLRIKLSAAAIVGGLVAAFGLGFIRVRMNSSIQRFSDIVELRPVPMLGHLSPQKGTPKRAEEAIAQLDQVRMLRTTLLRRLMRSSRGSVIQITSAGPRSGKTTTAVALAASMRDCGRRVMLVDTDFRNPSVAGRVNCENTPGLMELLRGQVEEREVLRDMDGITVVPAGSQNGVQAADMLANLDLVRRFERWRDEYELIILDGAPLLASADAAILSPQIDGTVMVVREQHCRREDVLTALGRVEAAGGELLGLIVIGKQKLSHYGYPSYGVKD